MNGRDRHAPAALRVIVADDDPLSRRAVRDALQQAGFTVIAEAADGRTAVELTLHYVPDVLLTEARLPDLDGLELIRRIRERAEQVHVIVHARVDDAALALRTLRAGAAGYLPKGGGLDALPRALHAAARGEAIVPRHMVADLVACLRSQREDASGLRPVRSPLTDREWEVLDLLCTGLSTDEVAERLVLTHETVRSHIKHLMRKLGVNSRQQAVAVARKLRDAAIT